LVVTKLDRLARSLRDATDITNELTKKGVALNLGGAVYDPTDPVGRLLFNVLGMVAEFEADLIRARTREGMAIAKAAGKLRGRKPKLTPSQEKHLVQLHRTGAHTTSGHRRALWCCALDGLPSDPTRRAVLTVEARAALHISLQVACCPLLWSAGAV
jgi:DNA invertase Pin-like site-specific DNA recombinase